MVTVSLLFFPIKKRINAIGWRGHLSIQLATFLVEQGYENVFSVIGGFDGWVKAGLPIETAY